MRKYHLFFQSTYLHYGVESNFTLFYCLEDGFEPTILLSQMFHFFFFLLSFVRFLSFFLIYIANNSILWQVYVTMYLNDCQRTAFYEGIGLDTKEFDMHVIIEVSTMPMFCNRFSSVISIIGSDIPAA